MFKIILRDTMPREYQLKRSPLDFNRIQKIAKELILESKEDRSLALETYRLFREMVEENPQDAAAKNLMADCLKIAQSSKNNVIKVMGLLVKLEESKQDKTKSSAKGESSVFSELDNLTNRFP